MKRRTEVQKIIMFCKSFRFEKSTIGVTEGRRKILTPLVYLIHMFLLLTIIIVPNSCADTYINDLYIYMTFLVTYLMFLFLLLFPTP